MDVQGASPRARLRKPKFTPDQVRVLMERVVARRAQLYGDSVSPLTVRKRIWQDVTLAVNRISHTPRSVSEVQKRWQDERRRIRHRAQDLSRALEETGVPMGHLSPLEEAVLSTLDEATLKEPPEVGSGVWAGAGAGIGSGVQVRVGVRAEAGLGTAPPPQTAIPQQSQQEELSAPQQPSPTPGPPTPIPVVCLQDIKLEPVESASPAGGGSGPQDWKFEWTVEESPVASLQTNSTTVTTPLQPPPDTTALHISPANQTRAWVHSPSSAPWRRRRRRRLGLRPQQRAPDRADCAGLAACLRRVASGTAGLQQELHALSDNVQGLRGELRALVSAVAAVASVLQGRHGDRTAERQAPEAAE